MTYHAIITWTSKSGDRWTVQIPVEAPSEEALRAAKAGDALELLQTGPAAIWRSHEATTRPGVRATVAIPAETLRAAKAGDARALKNAWRRCIRAFAATAPEAARSDAIGAAVAKALVKGLKRARIQ